MLKDFKLKIVNQCLKYPILGLIGPRFERRGRMDYEDIVITEQQNCLEHGYGEEVTPTTCLNVLKTTYVRNNQSAKHMWRQMWSEFYQVRIFLIRDWFYKTILLSFHT